MQIIYYDSFMSPLGPILKAIDEQFGSAEFERRQAIDRRPIVSGGSVVLGHGASSWSAMAVGERAGLVVTFNVPNFWGQLPVVKTCRGLHLNFIAKRGFWSGQRVEGAFNIELYDAGFFSICKSKTAIDFILANVEELKRAQV